LAHRVDSESKRALADIESSIVGQDVGPLVQRKNGEAVRLAESGTLLQEKIGKRGCRRGALPLTAFERPNRGSEWPLRVEWVSSWLWGAVPG
jgi:hypothetical protein